LPQKQQTPRQRGVCGNQVPTHSRREPPLIPLRLCASAFLPDHPNGLLYYRSYLPAEKYIRAIRAIRGSCLIIRIWYDTGNGQAHSFWVKFFSCKDETLAALVGNVQV
jgi:hypothetical protein